MPPRLSSEPSTPSPTRSFAQHTPEFRLGRSDSRNPASTCRGLTVNGRSCRRPIASVKTGSPGPGCMFCWQHRDQAATDKSKESLSTMRERTSMDSLVSRLGLMTVGSNATTQASSPTSPSLLQPRPRPNPRHPRYPDISRTPPLRQDHHRRAPRLGFWFSLCCMTIDEDDEEYRRSAPLSPEKPISPHTPMQKSQTNHISPVVPYRSRPSAPTRRPAPQPLGYLPPQSIILKAVDFPSLPRDLPQTVRSTLIAESSKPVSPYDEAGYIYIFWLTDNPGTPPVDAAATLLSPTSPASSGRANNIIRTYSTRRKTIMLKIGRANNVHRRLNEWSRQCGQNVSLVRWYPYAASKTPLEVGDVPIQKVPHAHRVERLIHMELANLRVTKSCEACGRQHREWFEVDASERGLKAVDEVVRRWVAFDLGT